MIPSIEHNFPFMTSLDPFYDLPGHTRASPRTLLGSMFKNPCYSGALARAPFPKKLWICVNFKSFFKNIHPNTDLVLINKNCPLSEVASKKTMQIFN